jgi:hypothetical protein
MECFICSQEQGAGGELPICVHSDGRKAHAQCFVKARAHALMNGWEASCELRVWQLALLHGATDHQPQSPPPAPRSEDDDSGFTFEWKSKVHVYLPTELAAMVKEMLPK